MLAVNRAKTPVDKLKALPACRPHLALWFRRTVIPGRGCRWAIYMAVTAAQWGISREAQDALAAASHQNLAAAYDRGFFDDLMTPYLGLTRDSNLRPDSTVDKLAKLPRLRLREGRERDDDGPTRRPSPMAPRPCSSPARRKRHHLTLRSSEFVDAETAAVDYVHGEEGLLMAPTYAVPRLLARNGLTFMDFDFYEIHEAFA